MVIRSIIMGGVLVKVDRAVRLGRAELLHRREGQNTSIPQLLPEQFGVAACSSERDLVPFDHVREQPVGSDVALPEILVVPAKLMVLELRLQRNALDELLDDCSQLIHRKMGLPAPLPILLELAGVSGLE